MPVRFVTVDTTCFRRGRFDNAKFTPSKMMGTTMLILIFKELVPDWPVILEFKANMDVLNAIEIPTLTN
jgi:hypothetical protein